MFLTIQAHKLSCVNSLSYFQNKVEESSDILEHGTMQYAKQK